MAGSGVRKGSVTGRVDQDTNTIRSGRIGGRKNDGMGMTCRNRISKAVKEDCDVPVGVCNG